MTENRYPLIRGRNHRTEFYVPPNGGNSAQLCLPPRTPTFHSSALLSQLDAIVEASVRRAPGTRDVEATRETIAVQPEGGFELVPSALGDTKADVRVIGVAENGVVLLDAKCADLPHLRRKIEEYGDDSKITKKGARKNDPAIAPISEVRLSAEEDVVGPRFLAAHLSSDSVRWF